MILKERRSSMFDVSPKVKNMFSWIELIIMKNFPLTLVDDDLMRKAVSYDPISSNSMKKYMELLCKKMEATLREQLPRKFGILFDGWTEGNDHYIALFACYEENGNRKYPLLAFQPIPDYNASETIQKEYEMTASAHKDFITSTLAFYDRDPEAMIFLVADNCNTNLCLARTCGVPLVGCSSHKLNLAVNKILEPYEPIIQNIQQLMSKLSYIKQAAKLRRSTDLQPIKRNVTRWSSTFSMIQRFFQLEEYLDVTDSELVPFIPSRHEEQQLRSLFSDLKDFESVSKKLQESEVNVLDARKLFDALIIKYPESKYYLATDARIVFSPSFDSGVCKLIEGNEDLNDYEVEALSPFQMQVLDDEGELSFADRVLKKQRLMKYKDVSFIPATSNYVERFFSASKLVMTNLRKSTLPKTLEMIMFLKFNRELWNARVLASVFNEDN